MTSELQLPAGSIVIVDETNLAPGQVKESGIRNISCLQKLVTEQRIPYDFAFYSTDFNTDLPTLVFSSGKSILKEICHVPLQKTEGGMSGTMHIDEGVVDKWRAYVMRLPYLEVRT